MKREFKWKRVVINNKKTNYFISNDGKVVNSNTGRILTNMFLDGQYRVHLQIRGDNNQMIDTHRSVAKLMLKTFKNIDQGIDEVLYFKDENPSNLTLDNMEYISIDDYYIKKRMHIFKVVDDHLVLIDGNYSDEIWKPIILDDLILNKFHISNYGRIINIITGNFLNPTISDGKYPAYSIRIRPNGSKKSITKRITVHIIVAKLFVYNDDPINKTIVHHKDNDINNYKYTNLEWVTPSMNLKYAVDDGLVLIGDSAKTATINKETAIKICEMIDSGYKTSEIVSTLGVSRNIVRHIRDGSSWKSVSKDYNFIINKDYVKDSNLNIDLLHFLNFFLFQPYLFLVF